MTKKKKYLPEGTEYLFTEEEKARLKLFLDKEIIETSNDLNRCENQLNNHLSQISIPQIKHDAANINALEKASSLQHAINKYKRDYELLSSISNKIDQAYNYLDD